MDTVELIIQSSTTFYSQLKGIQMEISFLGALL